MNESFKMCKSIVRTDETSPALGDSKLTSAIVSVDMSRTPEVSYGKRNNNEFMMIDDTDSVSPSSFSLSTAVSRSEANKQTHPTHIAMKNVFNVVEDAPSGVVTVTSSKRVLPNIVTPRRSRALRMVTETSVPPHSSSSSVSSSSSSFLSLCSSSMVLQTKNQRSTLKPKGQIFKMIPKKIKAMVKSSLPTVIHASKSSTDMLTLNRLDNNKRPMKVVSNQNNKKNKVTRAATKKAKTDLLAIKKSMKIGGATLESIDTTLSSIDNQDDVAVVTPSSSDISVQTIPSTTKSSSPPKTKEHYQPVTVQHDYHDHANDPPLFLLYDYHHQHQHDDYYLKEETGSTVKVDNETNVLGDHVADDDKKCHHDDDHSGYSKFHQDLRQRSVTIKRSTSSQQPFPMKLYDVLEIIMNENKYTNVISWQPHGRCFVIHDHVLFKSIILPEYFNLNIMASFQRQLNLYGFKRITQSTSKDKNGYYHEYFLRGRYDLLYGIHRIKIKGTGIRAKSNPEHEPKFWNNYAWITKRPYQQSTSTTTTTTLSSPIAPLNTTSITTASVISLSTMDNHHGTCVNGDGHPIVNHDHSVALEESMTPTDVISVQHHDCIDDVVSPTPMDLDENRDCIHHMNSNNISFNQNYASVNTFCDNDRHDFVDYSGNNGDTANHKSTTNDMFVQQLGNQSMDLLYGKSFLDNDIDDMLPLSISIFNDIRNEKDMETYLTSSSSSGVLSSPLLSPLSTPVITFPNVVTPLSKSYYISNDSMNDNSDNIESNLELNNIINKRSYLQQRCPSPMNDDNRYLSNNAENNTDDDLYSTTSTDDYFIPRRAATTTSQSNDDVLLGWGKPFHYLNYFYEKMDPPNTTTTTAASINNNTNSTVHGASSTNLISINDIRDDF